MPDSRPVLNPLAATALAAACVPMSVLPMANIDFPPELWHLTPLFAVGLLLGRGLTGWAAVMTVLAVRLTADLGIWAVTGNADWAFYGTSQLFVYGGLVVSPLIGRAMRNHRPATLLGSALAAPVAFYLVSNFGVAMGDPSRTVARVYVDGLPFLRNSLIATPVWAGILFSPPVLASLCVSRPTERAVSA